MRNFFNLRQLRAALFAAILILLLYPSNVSAVPIYAITQSGKLELFDSQQPHEIIHAVTISGLQQNESILAIDFRPATLQLYGLGSTSRLYVINTETGAATQVGGGHFEPLLSGIFFGFDFDPVADRIRVVSDTNQNLLLNPQTGAVSAFYEPTAYAPGDVNYGNSSEVTGLAYTNNVMSASTTTLYGFDYRHAGLLVKLDPLSSGKLKTIGRIRGLETSDAVGDKFAGFDISDKGLAYLALSFIDMDVGARRGFYSIDLAT